MGQLTMKTRGLTSKEMAETLVSVSNTVYLVRKLNSHDS